VPNQFKVGDAQFNIQVQNTGNVELKNLIAVVSGKGFSTYDVIPIDRLKAEEKSYIIVMGNFKDAGEISLSIRINDKVFSKKVSVSDPNAAAIQENITQTKEKEEADKKELEVLANQLNELVSKYKILEKELENKTENKYDVTNIKLDDLKEFLRNAQSSIIQKDIDQSKVGIALAQSEYEDLNGKLSDADIIKTSISSLLKDNAVLISTIAGSIIASFSLFELLKKKKDHLYETIKEIKINKDTKVVVEKKHRSKKNDNQKQEPITEEKQEQKDNGDEKDEKRN
jgi:hypothetical protein